MAQDKRKTILLIDDERDILESLSVFLRRHGYGVSIADNGKLGLKLARQEIPNLVILDLMLPDIDGTDVAVDLLNNPLTRDIPIIFLTGVVTKPEQEKMGEYIANRCIVAKPCRPEEILAHVKSHIGSPV